MIDFVLKRDGQQVFSRHLHGFPIEVGISHDDFFLPPDFLIASRDTQTAFVPEAFSLGRDDLWIDQYDQILGLIRSVMSMMARRRGWPT